MTHLLQQSLPDFMRFAGLAGEAALGEVHGRLEDLGRGE